MTRLALHFLSILLVTLLTQIGGLAWVVALFFRRRLPAFLVLYIGLSMSALWVAPLFGRVPLPCTGEGHLRVHSILYCALNRHYVVPEMKDTLDQLAQKVDQGFPGTTTLVLDANFPFIPGFPLLPHLSHNDGRKADIAFYYRDAEGYLPKKTRSPLGYFAFEPGPTDCPKQRLTLRWDMAWLQPLWPKYKLDAARMVYALEQLARDERIGKVFLEPHLKARFSPGEGKVRFQGCRAARHDDHIHIQLRE